MSVTDIFWLFFLFILIQPMIARKFMEAARKRMIGEIEKERKTRFILLVHHQVSMAFMGLPMLRFLDIQDSEEILRAIHMTDDDMDIDLVLHTPGGLVLAALQIARALKDHKGKVTVFVPHFALSGGTLIALAADEVVMMRHSVLGPVDPQIGKFAAPSILSVLKKKPMKDIDDQTLILADQSEKAIAQLEASVKELMSEHYDEEVAERLSHTLTEGRWTHDYPISFAQAKELGLKVSREMPDKVLELMKLFPQPVRSSRNVEYLPSPHHKEK